MTWISAQFNQLGPSLETGRRVIAGTTTRLGGVSVAPYDSLNLGAHVGDSDECVNKNRAHIHQYLNLPSAPVWLNQTHSCNVVELPLSTQSSKKVLSADAAFTHKTGVVCAVMTADCLPILLVNRQKTIVAAVHAGWRGLADGIVEETVTNMTATPEVEANDLYAWIGPAIGPQAFEVGAEVKSHFEQQYGNQLSSCFVPSPNTSDLSAKYLADLPKMAKRVLQLAGVQGVTLSNLCTYQDAKKFFSFRRDGQTGRMASFIWLE